MPKYLTKPASVLTLVLALVAIGTLLYLGVASFRSSTMWSTSSLRPASTGPDPTTAHALAAAGLFPKALAAAGLSGQQVTALVTNTRTYLADHAAAFQAALDNYRAASLDAQAREQKVRSGLASQEELSQFDTANTALASAAASRDTAVAALFSAATANLSAPAVLALSTIRANRGRALPVQYLTATRDDADWVLLRDALANDKVSTAQGVDPDPDAHQLLLDTNQQAAVSSAASGLANLPSLQQTWSQALNQ